MTRYLTLALLLFAFGAVVGCNAPTPGTTRALGDVSYTEAFATSREVMAQHFSVLSANPDTGQITCRPAVADVQGERILGGSPARRLAKLQLRREGPVVLAHASVALQREGSYARNARANYTENYDEVPNLTPADQTAATTPDQNELWRTERYDHALERNILDDIYRQLNPKAD